MIKMQVIGHLGKDAESKQVGDKTVINFSVAHSDKLKDGTTKSIWVDCAYWTDKTGIVPFLKKGTQVYVDGNPDTRAHNGKAYLTLRVGQVQLLGGKSDSQPPQSAAQTAPVDDLPF